MKRLVSFYFVLFIFIIFGCSGTGDPASPLTVTKTLTLQQGLNGYNGAQDASVMTAVPDGNIGTDFYLTINKELAGESTLTLLKFDLSYLMPGTTVKSASITLTANSFNFPLTVEVWRLGGAWEELSVTYTNMDVGFPVKINTIIMNGPSLVYTLPVQMVQEWVNNPLLNYGLIFQEAGEGSEKYATLYSSQNPSELDRPKMVITYEEDI